MAENKYPKTIKVNGQELIVYSKEEEAQARQEAKENNVEVEDISIKTDESGNQPSSTGGANVEQLTQAPVNTESSLEDGSLESPKTTEQILNDSKSQQNKDNKKENQIELVKDEAKDPIGKNDLAALNKKNIDGLVKYFRDNKNVNAKRVSDTYNNLSSVPSVLVTLPDGEEVNIFNVEGLDEDSDKFKEQVEKLQYINKKTKDASNKDIYIANSFQRDAVKIRPVDLNAINDNFSNAGYTVEPVKNKLGMESMLAFNISKDGVVQQEGVEAKDLQKWFYKNLSQEDFKKIEKAAGEEAISYLDLVKAQEKKSLLEENNPVKFEENRQELLNNGISNQTLIAELELESTTEEDDFSFVMLEPSSKKRTSYDINLISQFLNSPIKEEVTVPNAKTISGTSKQLKEVENWPAMRRQQLEDLNSFLIDPEKTQGEKNAKMKEVLGGIISNDEVIKNLNKLLNEKVGIRDEDVDNSIDIKVNNRKSNYLETLIKKDPNVQKQLAYLNYFKKTNQGLVENDDGSRSFKSYEVEKEGIKAKQDLLLNDLKKKQESFTQDISTYMDGLPSYIQVKSEQDENGRVSINVSVADNYIDEETATSLKGIDSERKKLLPKLNSLERKVVGLQNQYEKLVSQINAGDDDPWKRILAQQVYNQYQSAFEELSTENKKDVELVEQYNKTLSTLNKPDDQKRKQLQEHYQKELNEKVNLFNEYNENVQQAYTEITTEFNEYVSNIQDVAELAPISTKEYRDMVVLQKDFKNGVNSMIFSIGSLTGSEYSKTKLKAIQDGTANLLPTMLTHQEAVKLGRKSEFVTRTLSQQATPALVAIGSSAIGLPPVFTAAVFSLSQGGETLVSLETQQQQGKDAKLALSKLNEDWKNGKVSRQDYLKRKKELETTISLGDMSRRQIVGATLAAMASEFAITYGANFINLGTIGNSRKVIQDLSKSGMPTMGELITRSNFQALGQYLKQTGAAIGGEVAEEVAILLSSELSNGLILKRDFDFSQIDDTIVSSIILGANMNGFSGAYSTITAQYATRESRAIYQDVKSEIQNVQSQMEGLTDKRSDALYRKQLQAKLSNLFDQLNVGQAGLEIDALVGGSVSLETLVKNSLDLVDLHQAAGVKQGMTEDQVNDKVEKYLDKLDKTDKKAADSFRARMENVNEIKNKTINDIQEQYEGDILSEGGLVDKLFGKRGRQAHDFLNKKNSDFADLNNRQKLLLINMHVKNSFLKSEADRIKKYDNIRELVERNVYNGKTFKEAKNENPKLKRNKKAENQVLESFAQSTIVGAADATSIYRGGKEAVSLILKNNPNIKELSDLEVESDLTVEQIKEKLDEFNIPEDKKQEIIQGLSDGSIKGTIFDGKYITTASKTAVNQALRDGNILQGTVFSHEVGHALDAITMKRGEINDFAINLNEALKSDSELYDLHRAVVNSLSNIVVDDKGTRMWDVKKGMDVNSQSDLAKDEYTKRVQDLMQHRNFKNARKKASKMSGQSTMNILRGVVKGDYKFDTPQDAIGYLVDYLDSFEQNKLSKFIERKIKAKTSRIKQLEKTLNKFGKVEDDSYVVKDNASTADQKKFQEALSEYNDIMEKPGYRKSADKGPTIDKIGQHYSVEDWRNGGFQVALNVMQQGKMLDGLILAAQAKANPSVPMKNKPKGVKKQFINDVYAELTSHVKNYDVTKHPSLFSWINTQLGNKSLNVQKSPELGYSPDKISRAKDVDAKTEEGAPVVQLQADTDAETRYIDNIGLKETDTELYSQLRQDINLNEELMDKVVQVVTTTFGTRLPDVSDTKFRIAIEKAFKEQLKKPIQKMIGVRADYDAFLVEHFPAVFNALSTETLVQMERNVDPELRIFTDSRRITEPTEVDQLISDGLLPMNTVRGEINRTSGPFLNTKKKLPSDAKILAFFRGTNMEAELGYKVVGSTLGTRKDALAMNIGVELAFDATSEVLSKPDVQKRRRKVLALDDKTQIDNEKALIAKIIDRDPNILFSREGKTNKIPKNYTGEMFGQHFDQLVNDIISSKDGVNSFIDSKGKLIKDYVHEIPQFTVDVVNSLYTNGSIPTTDEVQFKKGIAASNLDEKTKKAYSDDGVLSRNNKDVLDKIDRQMNFVFDFLGGDIINELQRQGKLEIFAYHLRYLDPAKKKRGLDKSGDYYSSLQDKINRAKQNPDGKTDVGIDIGSVNAMNTKIQDSVLNDVIEIANMPITAAEKRQMYLDSIADRVVGANNANPTLAKHIAKTLITLARNKTIGKETVLHILQAQTQLAGGFRAFTDLAMIDFRDGSQALYVDKDGNYTNDKNKKGISVNTKHPQFKEVKSVLQKAGELKNLTPDQVDKKVIELLKFKGEHLTPNANTMLEIGKLIDDTSVDLDNELDRIFNSHSQLLTSDYVTKKIDGNKTLGFEGLGRNSTLGYDRVGIVPQDSKFFIGPNGETLQDVLANKKYKDSMVLFSKDGGKISNNIKKTFIAEENIRKAIETGETNGMSTFDFDETVGVSENFIIANKDGKTKRISSANWPKVGEKLAAEGWQFDFSDFNKVTKGKPGPLFQKMKNQIAKYGSDNVFILTARASESEQAIHDWLKSNGINIPRKNVTGLGNSTGEAKAQWMLDKFAEGYNDMYFVDDAITNVEAVKNVLDQLDIKSKVVQAKIKFSKDADATFNEMLERSLNIGKEKVFSAAEARIRGRGKGKFDFFIPPSAEDFKGLLYSFLGKGKQGDADMEFFKENLLKPYAQGYKDWNTYKQNMADDYSNLKKRFPNVVKSFNDIVPGTNFTAEMAARVYLWNKSGIDIPGLSKQAKTKLLSYVNANADLRSFAENTAAVTKNKDGYIKPRDYWMTETFASDLANTVNNVGRQQFLANWQQNSDIIFSEKNLNKIEAAKGPAFREALENMLYRMKTGNNRMTGTDRTVNRFQNWVNGSVGAIMFFNIRSAGLQTISTLNYIDFADNNLFAASKAFANQPQYWKDFAMLFNSPMLKQRRAGLAIDVSSSELSKAFSDGRGKPQALLNYLLQIGFTPTQIADNFAIASGGAVFYRNKVNRYLKDGMTKVDAENQAFLDFQEKTEETQQSARPDLISQQQAGPLGRLVLAFQNTPMQMTRLTKKAISDLVNNRGDRKANISKIIYYGAMQNLLFGTLQSGLAFMMFGSDEEDDEKKKMSTERVMNGALDTLLRGTGIYGAGIATLKNTLLQWQEEKQKSFGQRDDTRILLQALNLSPPIGSKIRKINNAIKTEKFNKGVSKELGFRIENPNLNKWANIIEGTTNFPLARMVNKANNLEEAITGDHETWKRVALIGGWDKWSLNVKDEELEAAKVEAKRKRKEEKKKIKEQEKIKKQKEEEERKKKEGIKKVQCSGIRSNGQRCSIMIETKNETALCQHHKTRKEGEDKDGDGLKEYRCTATKSNGQRCNNYTENKNKKCYAHQ